MTPDDVLAGLSSAQREAAEALAGPVVILAGPGSGKTRTITHRIAYGVAADVYEPARTLALTFTTRAAGELRRRLSALDAGPVAVRTFHAAALRQLRYFWPDAIGGALPRIESDRASLLAVAAARHDLPDDRDTVAQLLTELDWTKGQGITPAGYAAAAAPGRPQQIAAAADVGRVLAAYEELKTEHNVVDFDDVLLITIGLLESRTDLRESVRRAYRWITVDEYQDVSPLQERLLGLWAGERANLCVVGDPAQTIYQFAGADPTLLPTFPRRYPGTTVVELAETYRCAPRIAAGANRLAAAIPGALHLRSRAGTGEPGAIQVLQFPTDRSEAAGIADEVAGLIRGGHPPGEIACLYRAHFHGRALQDELRRRRVPFAVRGGERFWRRAEVKEAVTRFRAEVRLAPGGTPHDAMTAALTAMGHDPQVPDSPAARDRWESLASLAALYPPEGTSGAEDALARLDARVADDEPPPPAGVSLLTLHAAKGLEWDTVFMVAAADGDLPYVRAQTDEARAEERRLCYVGFTRPRRRLVVSWSRHGPRGPNQQPSPFVAALQADATVDVAVRRPQPAEVDVRGAAEDHAAEDHAGEGRPPARCRMCGRALVTGVERVVGRCGQCPSTADPVVLGALRGWRDTQASREGLPPHAVLTDAALVAVAEQRPRDEAELSRIPGLRPAKVERYARDVLDLLDARPIMQAITESGPGPPGT